MVDNIRPEHYRKGEFDLYEAFSKIFPHNEYRAGMQMIAMRYMFRDKIDRVEDLGKAIYTLERLKEKEIERSKDNEIEQEKRYFAKVKGWDILDGNSNWVYLKNSEEFMLGEVTFCGDKIDVMTKEEWNGLGINDTNADFEEVEVWEVDISETYQNGGENGKS